MSIDRPGAARPRLAGPLRLRPILLLASCLWWARPAHGQQLAASHPTAASAPSPTSAPRQEWPTKFQLHWNEYNLGVTTFLVGAAMLTDYASYNQDSASASK